MFDLKNRDNWEKALRAAVRLGITHADGKYGKYGSKALWDRLSVEFGGLIGCMGHMRHLRQAYGAAYEGVALTNRLFGN